MIKTNVFFRCYWFSASVARLDQLENSQFLDDSTYDACWWYSLCTFQYRPRTDGLGSRWVLHVSEPVWFFFDVYRQGRVGSRLTLFFIDVIVQVPGWWWRWSTPTTHTCSCSRRCCCGRSFWPRVPWKCRYVKSVCIIHVGGTRCVTSRTANNMKIRARITLTVEFIRTCIFLFWFDV